MLASPLPRRVRHKEFETGLSLALRLAHRHGATWTIFRSATGLPVSGLRVSEALPQLSACSSVPEERLGRWTPRWFGHDVEVLGHRFDRSRFLRLNLRICPHCMEEDVAARAAGERAQDAAYLRLDWCLAFIFGCERHRVKLISRCPACNERPKWKVGRIDACHCGSSLLRQPEAVTGEEFAVLRMLGNRLHGRDTADCLLPGTSGVPLADLVNLLRLLGEVSDGGRHASNASCALEVDNLSTLLVHGARALDALPMSFERVLDSLAAAGPGAHRGVTEVYGLPIVRWMRSDRPYVEALRPIFEAHSARNATIQKSRLPGAAPSRHSFEVARRRRPLSLPEMDRLTKATGWAGASPARRDEVKAAASDAIFLLKDAAEYIGVGWRCFRSLREAGVVSPCWAVRGAENEYYYRAEIDELLRRLRSGATEFGEVPPTLQTLPQVSRRKAVEWCWLIVEILAGRIACQGVLIGLVGVQALILDASGVKFCFKRRPPDTITKSAACSLLGLNPDAWKAVDGRLLASTTLGFTSCVSWDAVEGFDRAFISLTRISSHLDMAVPKARAYLEASDVVSVVSGERFSIYARSGAEAVFPSLAGFRIARDAGWVCAS